MQFLRTLFWVVIAVIAAIFAVRNWTNVPINLWGGLQADAKLPVLLGVAFLIGFIPPMILYRTTRWRARRRLENVDRQLVELRGGTTPTAASPMAPIATPEAGAPLTIAPGQP